MREVEEVRVVAARAVELEADELPAGSSPATVRGCALHNVAVEAAGTMPEATALVERHKKEFAARVIEAAAEAREPEILGRQLAVLFEGARALATSLNDTRPLQDAQALAETLLDRAAQPT
ncbi:hypothetical protein ACQPXM_11095 [Kribbella sp. CA-253562]|uniref:hypothetical protein n=1 Tax=Kribbella sp. CA-253562 TaxID=3239942 RepID=UPI003D9023DA